VKRLFIIVLLLPAFLLTAGFVNPETQAPSDPPPSKDFVKWIDFNVKKDVLAACQKKHKTLVAEGITDIGTCELLAYLALKNGNRFNTGKDLKRLSKTTPDDVRRYNESKYYNYYVKSYHAVLDGIIDPKSGDIIGYFPLAHGFWYSHHDDFGNSRGYGYKRKHLGNDLFGGMGTPVIAVEGGVITELGWNRYGGWRVGIRSGGLADPELGHPYENPHRYYYYAHLRKGKPFAEGLAIGDTVAAGQVIGYLGATGYSRKPDTNMKSKPHLHFGMQIIFDPSQEDGVTELWMDVYEINRFLARNRARVE